ncbi:MAG: dimethylamine corrinoid protein 3 [Deltaproteobacteria bacterium]|nr:dimethylamine corrinoid protein 3 [Deltaproteobacteria bacterium]
MSAATLDKKIMEAVLDGDADDARSLAGEALSTHMPPRQILSLYIAGIREVGRLWEEGEYFLPELVSGAESVMAALDVLGPALTETESQTASISHVAIVGTVQGDVHDIGKSLVGNMLMARGFEVIDLGTDVSADAFADAVEQHGAILVGISALLTTTMLAQKTVMDKLVERGLRDKVKVLVGGSPVTSDWAEEIGADGTAEDAFSAAELASEMVGL